MPLLIRDAQQGHVAREHGKDGEHRTFSAASTAAHSAPVGGSHLRNTKVATRHGNHRNGAIS